MSHPTRSKQHIKELKTARTLHLPHVGKNVTILKFLPFKNIQRKKPTTRKKYDLPYVNLVCKVLASSHCQNL